MSGGMPGGPGGMPGGGPGGFGGAGRTGSGTAGKTATAGVAAARKTLWYLDDSGKLAVALVGANQAPGILLAGLLFGMLKAAGPLMQSNGIPKEIGGIIQASIVLFVAMKYGLERLLAFARLKRSRGTELPGTIEEAGV